MKKTPSHRSAAKVSAAKKTRKADPASRLGGQPENDEDARAAGLKSATSGEPRNRR